MRPVGTRARAGGQRRTQPERRTETRAALLEATIECLVTHGYANTTTGRISALAGVSRGAYPPYFRTRAELFAAAITHLAKQRADAIRERFANTDVTLGEALDALWEETRGRAFDAALELWVAARTDAELRRQLQRAEREIVATIAGEAAAALGDRAQHPKFADDLLFVLATLRGIALMSVSNGGASRAAEHLWQLSRERLLNSMAT